jgi:hypothetical protein
MMTVSLQAPKVSQMPPIDFMTCTARDVIARSLLCHPSTLAGRLMEVAKTHAGYSIVTPDATVAAIARRMGEKAFLAASHARVESIEPIMADFDQVIATLHCACELQLVPRSLRGDIAARMEA